MSDANPFTIARLMALIGFDCKITSAFNASKWGMIRGLESLQVSKADSF